jgi:hypothetical protein
MRGMARGAAALVAGMCAVISAPAWGAIPSGGETGPPSAPGAASCPASNPPNTLTLVGGTPQSTALGSVFATNLQVAFTNSDGCPVTTALAGLPVTFSAPSVGASGLFAASESSTVTVGSDAAGMVSAPALTAEDIPGSYMVTASSPYGAVSFSLTNAKGSSSSACGSVSSPAPATGPAPASLAGEPAKLTAGIGATQSVRAGARFPIRLAVTVTDAEKIAVPGVLVTFAAPAHGPSGRFSTRTHPRRVEVRSDACGVALAPPFTANHHQGGYIVVASVAWVRTAFALVNEGP